MFSLIATTLGRPLGIKTLKYFVDSVFRERVTPVPGSVVYCDLWIAAEHSGIYVGDGRISNIEVTGVPESTVRLSDADGFTSKSLLGRGIYVSCDNRGAVGHASVAEGATSHLGERAFYGLVISNCHGFSRRCVNYADTRHTYTPLLDNLSPAIPGETWEPTLGLLKQAARKRLGATKWRLWNRDSDAGDRPPPEPDWQEHADYFMNLRFDASGIAAIQAELAATQAYEAEIADEDIPADVRRHIGTFRETLSDILQKYEEAKDFLAQCPGADFSYATLGACTDDFSALAKTLRDNAAIRELVRRMGRDYISEEKRKRTRVPEAGRSEVHGTHRSDDVMRLLPSELLNLEDETLETLFHARLLERNLLSYELRGVTFTDGEETESARRRTGPVVACLDTSSSMRGMPLLKAKALLLAIAGILKQEGRSLHVLLFGSVSELREFSMEGKNDSAGLLSFLKNGFGGGTDFETPLRRAFEIIGMEKDYMKADVLMISDGDCDLGDGFAETLKLQKTALDCMVYSVLCAGSRVADGFSDEVVVL
jgi:uncharacterized protein with von Willebrand factor type A (vWA) domain